VGDGDSARIAGDDGPWPTDYHTARVRWRRCDAVDNSPLRGAVCVWHAAMPPCL
jgi:hypothetical protein